MTAWARRFLHGLPVALATLVIACAAAAQAPPATKPALDVPGPSWSSLTPQQRSVLAPLQNDWSSIDAPRRAKWLELAARYPKMPPDDQQRMQARMSEWSRLSPQERGQARLNYQQAKQLPKQDRRDQWNAYQALPESERKALAERAQTTGKPAPVARPAPEAPSKRNIVANPSHSAAPVKPVAPTVVQAAPGATTTLVTRQPSPPAHQQAGMPKIAATPGFVDRNTLLPQRGPQGASVRNPPPPASKP